jgi:EamA domain-containing membrane protein RarD
MQLHIPTDVVHLSNAYVHSPRDSAPARMREALRELGISIVAGAATTLSSSLFLFGGVMLFFYKFGVLMALTVTMSFCWSIVFFSIGR